MREPMNFPGELIEKALRARSAEELAALAQQAGYEMTPEQAQVYFAQLHPRMGELSDNELGNVSGGCHMRDGRLVVNPTHSCDLWVCKDHGTRFCLDPGFVPVCPICNRVAVCKTCKYGLNFKSTWLCNHPKQ